MASAPSDSMRAILGPYRATPPPTRPHVTLTFAQSLDAKIAGVGGSQLILSGKESMVMTHWMRTMHDGILVGIGTALNDDPQLNVRHLPPPPPTTAPHHLPRPIIIDTHLRLRANCKLLKNFQNQTGRRPWVLCSPINDAEGQERKKALEAAGAKVVETAPAETPASYLSVTSILQTLRDLGIRSLMVEGGARIIGSFLAELVVDTLIITIAPVLIGSTGVGYEYPTILSQTGGVEKFKVARTEIVGQDTVVSLLAVK